MLLPSGVCTVSTASHAATPRSKAIPKPRGVIPGTGGEEQSERPAFFPQKKDKNLLSSCWSGGNIDPLGKFLLEFSASQMPLHTTRHVP